MKREIPNPYLDKHCFYCGVENPAGLKLRFFWDDVTGKVNTDFYPSQWLAGQGKILHGGFQMGLLDEIMAWTGFFHTHEMAVTSAINVQFLKPLYIDSKIFASASLISKEGPKIHLQAELRNSAGEICTTATGIFHILKEARYKTLLNGD